MIYDDVVVIRNEAQCRFVVAMMMVLDAGCHWSIGDDVSISVFGDPWTSDRTPILATDSAHSNTFL